MTFFGSLVLRMDVFNCFRRGWDNGIVHALVICAASVQLPRCCNGSLCRNHESQQLYVVVKMF